MNKILIFITLIVLGSKELSISQTLLPIPPYTHSSNGDARGFWFTAPVGVTVVSLMVPYETGFTYQSAEILRLTTPPDPWPILTNSFTSLVYFQRVSGISPMTCNIPINAGDVIMVLGVRSSSGDTTCENRNNFGRNSDTFYSSNFCEIATDLTVAGSQHTLCLNSALDVFSEPILSYHIARIEVVYICNPLSVEISGFFSKTIDKKVELSWETHSELGFSYFEIERSILEEVEYYERDAPPVDIFINADDFNNIIFESVEKITGKGAVDVVTKYKFIDNNAHPGLNYYRLKKVDENGSISYSMATRAYVDMEESHFLSLAPNPSSSYTEIRIMSLFDQTAKVIIFDIGGKKILNKECYLKKGVNNIPFYADNIPSGIYHIMVYLAESKTIKTVMTVK